jgi:CRISPR/Cas system-associated exonuclease Cas4 (RecB family)
MVKEIQPYADELIPRHALSRLQSLSFFYKCFYEKTSRLGMMTRSMKYRTAAEHILASGLDRFERVLFAGFFALTRCEKELFRKLFPDEKVTFVFQDGPGLKEHLSDLGMEATDREPSMPGPEIHFYSSPDTHGQVFALGGVLKEKSETGGPPDIGTAIVLPSSETLFPLLRQGTTCLGRGDFNISMGYPMHRTPVFGFMNNLMELTGSMEEDRLYIPDYIKFILHPYVKNIYFRGNAEVTRIMFHTVEEVLRKSGARMFATLSDIEDNEKVLDGIIEKLRQEEEGIRREEIREHLRMVHRNTIGMFLFFRDIGDFAAKCTELLTFVFNHSTARLHPLFYPFSETFIKALDAVSVSLLKEMSFGDRTGYFTFFRKYMMAGHVPFPGTPLKGLQILGFLETRNIRFDTVYILDANEEVLPDTAKDDTLLPFKAREILGLPTYLDRDRLSAYYFDNLVRGAKEIHIFSVENDTKERSRFVESLLWERQKKDRSTRASDYVQAVQYKVRLGNDTPSAASKNEGIVSFLKDFTYSATALDTYLGCPLQFYRRYVLDLGKREEITGEIERADIGKFVHRILSSYFGKRRDRVLKEEDINPEQMDLLIDALFDREYGPGPTGAVYLLKTQIKAHLREYLTKYRLPLIKETNLTIIGVEEPVGATFGSYKLQGRMDVVEKRDGMIFIVDYKTGSHSQGLKINFDKLDPESRDSWYEAIGSLQLPFYLMLYSQSRGIRIEDLQGMFLLLGRSAIDSEIELPLFAQDNDRSAFEGLRTVILGLLDEIVDPAVPFAAAPNMKNSCPRCDFRYICGTQWVTA